MVCSRYTILNEDEDAWMFNVIIKLKIKFYNIL